MLLLTDAGLILHVSLQPYKLPEHGSDYPYLPNAAKPTSFHQDHHKILYLLQEHHSQLE